MTERRSRRLQLLQQTICRPPPPQSHRNRTARRPPDCDEAEASSSHPATECQEDHSSRTTQGAERKKHDDAVEKSPQDAGSGCVDEDPTATSSGPFEDRFCLFARRGARRTMEDRYIAVPAICGNTQSGYYAVFDGHRGKRAAEFASQNLHLHLFTELEKQDVPLAMIAGFEKTDESFLEEARQDGLQDGCTATAAIIKNGKVFVGWVGDSRAMVVSRRTGQAKLLTNDHTPDREDERRRIEASNGILLRQGTRSRVNGSLAVSRAFGDLELKRWILGTPETAEHRIGGESEYLVLATDGLWKYVEPQLAADVACNVSLFKTIARTLIKTAYDMGSLDDQACIVIDLGKYLAKSPAPPTRRLFLDPLENAEGRVFSRSLTDESALQSKEGSAQKELSPRDGLQRSKSDFCLETQGSLRKDSDDSSEGVVADEAPMAISVTPAEPPQQNPSRITTRSRAAQLAASNSSSRLPSPTKSERSVTSAINDFNFMLRGPGLSGSSNDFTTQSSSSPLSSPPRSWIRTRRAAAADPQNRPDASAVTEVGTTAAVLNPASRRPKEDTDIGNAARPTPLRPPPLSSEKIQQLAESPSANRQAEGNGRQSCTEEVIASSTQTSDITGTSITFGPDGMDTPASCDASAASVLSTRGEFSFASGMGQGGNRFALAKIGTFNRADSEPAKLSMLRLNSGASNRSSPRFVSPPRRILEDGESDGGVDSTEEDRRSTNAQPSPSTPTPSDPCPMRPRDHPNTSTDTATPSPQREARQLGATAEKPLQPGGPNLRRGSGRRIRKGGSVVATAGSVSPTNSASSAAGRRSRPEASLVDVQSAIAISDLKADDADWDSRNLVHIVRTHNGGPPR